MRRSKWIAALAALTAAMPAWAVETIAYSYDARGRLVTVTRSPTPGASQLVVTSYTRDQANNRVVKSTSGSPNP